MSAGHALSGRRAQLAAECETHRARLRFQAQEVRAAIQDLTLPVRALAGPLIIGGGVLLVLLITRRKPSCGQPAQTRKSLVDRMRGALVFYAAARGLLAQMKHTWSGRRTHYD